MKIPTAFNLLRRLAFLSVDDAAKLLRCSVEEAEIYDREDVTTEYLTDLSDFIDGIYEQAGNIVDQLEESLPPGGIVYPLLALEEDGQDFALPLGAHLALAAAVTFEATCRDIPVTLEFLAVPSLT